MFPHDFLWGASTSAYQFEGASLSHGKGPSVMDSTQLFKKLGVSDVSIASDHYNRYEEDVALMAEMGFKAYRFSISWSRIFPSGTGAVNQEGVDFYHCLLNELEKYQITPIVTMYHFDLPDALQKNGGWNERSTIDAFENYAKFLFKTFGERVKHWLTINEQNMMILHGDVLGLVDKNDPDGQKKLYQQNHHMLLAQAKAMVACHNMVEFGKVAPAPNIASIYPRTAHPEDVLAANTFSSLRNWLYLDVAVHGRYNAIAWAFMEKNGITPVILDGDMDILAAAKPDFIAFNYYTTMCVERDKGNFKEQIGDQQIPVGKEGYFVGCNNPELNQNDFGWTIDPVGLRTTFREVFDRYNLPMMITENGLGAKEVLITGDDGLPTVNDNYRIDYYKTHIKQMELAINDGCPVIGYCPWTAIDLVSTHQGVSKRYGFVYVNRDEFDMKDLARYKKKSFYWYQKVIKTNGEDL